MSVDVFACIVFPIEEIADGEVLQAASWKPGPLPLPLPEAGTSLNRGTAQVADAAARSSHIARRVAGTLHDPRVRTHRVTADVIGDVLQVEAWELLVSPVAKRGYAVAHVRILTDDPASVLSSATAKRGPTREALLSSGDLGTYQAVNMRPFIVSHATFTGPQLPEPVGAGSLREGVPEWDAQDRWEWLLGTGQSPSELVPDLDESLSSGITRLSRDWRAHAYRAGVSYVARTPRGSASFHDLARVLVRTIHLDAILLGLIQRDALHHLADSLVGESASVVPADGDEEPSAIVLAEAMEHLEANLMEFRTRVWWGAIGNEGQQVSRVLQALQSQLGLPRLYDQVVRDADDVSRYVRARVARLQAEQVETERRQSNKSQSTIALVSFLLLPLTVVYSAAALLGERGEGWSAVGIATAVGLALGGLGWVATRPKV